MKRVIPRLVLPLAALLLSNAFAAEPRQAARPHANPFAENTIAATARLLVADKDWLGFRSTVRRAYGLPITNATWLAFQGLISENAEHAGYDLIPLWNARHPTAKTNLDKTLEYADGLMLARDFEGAFTYYQNMASYLSQTIKRLSRSTNPAVLAWVRDAKALYPFILHSMGRALYGAKRYAEALKVYQWIPQKYPYYRQTLFEKMWTAFRLGRVEIALGAIASQKSAYFSQFLMPEAYLLETYIYRKMCRNEDLNHVEREMKKYQEFLTRGKIVDWAVNDVGSRILWNLTRLPPRVYSPRNPVPQSWRDREQAQLKSTLDQIYLNSRPGTLKSLATALAYSRLSATAVGSAALKPVESFTSRDAYFKHNLEIWPAKGDEDWIDEIGAHQFIGESQCKAGASQ